ncbi:MAG: ribulose-phosphate 3-epimerase [Clostridia bacterium]|nr:ribulose-phosphate 3-epimerase [Clostridia bacterium]
MKKVVVSVSSMPAGRNMSAQLEFIVRVGTYGADMYHLDVMDGVFTKYKTIDYEYFEQLREKSPILFDCHLMVANPQKVINKYINSPANIITVHYESFEDKDLMIKVLKKIKKAGKMVGLAIDLDTKINVIDPFIKLLDLVLIMSVKAGKGGQDFDNSAIKKIKYVRKLSPEILIEVDGGINDKTAPLCVKAGADILAAGSYVYNNDTYDAIATLKGKNG